MTHEPDPEHVRDAARELAALGLSDRDVDAALRLPPGWSAGLLAETAGTPSAGE